ncbi:MFS transporter [Luteococcus japonicus]|uniref:Major facilitator superfamily MFS_1 n=1 Tax=Luteococcus japonicus LSP_Lj1 TaxID=1255658 RepID=A0A1R4KN59_9ACTN|nr:MFS transporter [Luteococcus japonicus]SJN45826.1 major facilitator superfamily MFS_1 [Luteococcus japonicus LSP_Lj1]
MSDRRGFLLDTRPFTASRHFTWMWLGALVAGVGNALTAVAVGLHVYELTHSTFAVSMVGVAALVPTLFAGLYGGTIVDRFDRRLVALASAVLAWLATAAILLLAMLERETIWSLYVLSALNAMGATLVSASRQAIIPNLLEPELLPAAGALNGMSMGLVVTLGPALAGLLVARHGFAITYGLDLLLFCGAFLGLAALPPMPPEPGAEHKTWAAIRESFRYIRATPVVAMSFIVDIVAMTLGNPRSLFPALGAVVIGGGAVTAGLLAASSAIGAVLCSLFSGRIVGWKRHGRAVNLSVIAYGLFTVGLGIVALLVHTGHWPGGVGSPDRLNHSALAAAMLMLFGMGASDNVSAIFRNTILQQAVPDRIRGRMQGIYIMVVTGGPRLGDLFVGLVALGAVWAPPLVGGLAIAAVVAALIRLVPVFHHYDATA